MFTGIVEEIGTIVDINTKRITVKAKDILEDLKVSNSIAINGVCLTITSKEGSNFSVDIMPETIRRTSFTNLNIGDAVNLERALLANGRIGGHFVQGHVDGTGKIMSLIPEGEALLMRISAQSDLARYIVEKGFVAVDGVSLTTTRCNDSSFEVSLITYTRNYTALGRKKQGNLVNIEVDIIAKYVEKYSDKSKDDKFINFLSGYNNTKIGQLK